MTNNEKVRLFEAVDRICDYVVAGPLTTHSPLLIWDIIINTKGN
jgi:hypothetical protein